MKILVVLKIFVFAAVMTLGLQTQAQRLLPGAQVWSYEDGSIAVRFRGQDKFYIPADQAPVTPPQRPIDAACANRPSQQDIIESPYLENVTIQPDRAAGGTTYSVDLSKFANIKDIQVRVLRGSVQIYSAQLTNKFNFSRPVTQLTALRLCQDQGLTASVNGANLSSLNLKIESYSADTVVSVNIQYENAKCGGCNVHGCWVEGGGCNVHGCSIVGGGCNVHGCWIEGGGCNVHGCWTSGGSCNVHGCLSSADRDLGRASNRPSCE